MRANGQEYFAQYSSFQLDNEAANYTLYVNSYKGNAGPASPDYGLLYSNNMPFSTYDRDNDQYDGASCAAIHKGGFWYKMCSQANLNTVFQPSNLYWAGSQTVFLQLEFVEMKIRPIVL
ncbi:hypothetical protein EGW08_018385 [Elysia chlorotica]|uniref:Fibrinogen C-terminal domain-containing protein n=1 Tax=Elysia chlorotica TaxID=188477 RepID=A0A3S1B7C1_ELYCH|nr:hypothetical protein EGW08_018385 [Elysia chlorotica]